MPVALKESQLVSQLPSKKTYGVVRSGGVNALLTLDMLAHRTRFLMAENEVIHKVLRIIDPVIRDVVRELQDERNVFTLEAVNKITGLRLSSLREASIPPESALALSRAFVGRIDSKFQGTINNVRDVINQSVAEAADTEAASVGRMIKRRLPAGALRAKGIAVVDNLSSEQVRRIIRDPLGGEFASRLRTRYGTSLAKVRATMASGMIQGKDLRGISKDVKGVLDTNLRSGAARLARTELHRVINEAQSEIHRRNRDVIKAERWLATLDARICILDGRSKVKTNKGWKQIRHVKVGDVVLTHNDAYRKVSSVSKRSYTGKIVKISIPGRNKPGRHLSVTEDHEILVERDGERFWLPAKHLSVGDGLIVPGKLCAGNCGEILPEWKSWCYSCNTRKRNAQYWTNEKRIQMGSNVKRLYRDPKLGRKMRAASKRNVKNMQTPTARLKAGLSKHLRWMFDEEFRLKMSAVLKKNANSPNNVLKNPKTREEMLRRAHHVQAKTHLCTGLERKVGWVLKKLKIKYTQGCYLPVDRKRYWVDFFLPDYGVVIEADGNYFHQDSYADDLRQAAIQNEYGVRFIRFSQYEITEQLGSVVVPTLQRLTDGCLAVVPVKRVAHCVLTDRLAARRARGRLCRSEPYGHAVYDLTVEGDSSFFVNGIAVHNCLQCANLDGREFKLEEGPRPPIHPNDRCIRIPVTKSWEEMGLDPALLTKRQLREVNGLTAPRLKFVDFFRTQSASFQRQVLGKTRFDLWQQGLIRFDQLATAQRIRPIRSLVRMAGRRRAELPQVRLKGIKATDDPEVLNRLPKDLADKLRGTTVKQWENMLKTGELSKKDFQLFLKARADANKARGRIIAKPPKPKPVADKPVIPGDDLLPPVEEPAIRGLQNRWTPGQAHPRIDKAVSSPDDIQQAFSDVILERMNEYGKPHQTEFAVDFRNAVRNVFARTDDEIAKEFARVNLSENTNWGFADWGNQIWVNRPGRNNLAALFDESKLNAELGKIIRFRDKLPTMTLKEKRIEWLKSGVANDFRNFVHESVHMTGRIPNESAFYRKGGQVMEEAFTESLANAEARVWARRLFGFTAQESLESVRLTYTTYRNWVTSLRTLENLMPKTMRDDVVWMKDIKWRHTARRRTRRIAELIDDGLEESGLPRMTPNEIDIMKEKIGEVFDELHSAKSTTDIGVRLENEIALLPSQKNAPGRVF